MKSFAMLAMSAIMSSSIAFIAPAMAADDANNGMDEAMQGPSDNMMMSQNNNMMPPPSAPGDGMAASADEGSPDVATGDDDY